MTPDPLTGDLTCLRHQSRACTKIKDVRYNRRNTAITSLVHKSFSQGNSQARWSGKVGQTRTLNQHTLKQPFEQWCQPFPIQIGSWERKVNEPRIASSAFRHVNLSEKAELIWLCLLPIAFGRHEALRTATHRDDLGTGSTYPHKIYGGKATW